MFARLLCAASLLPLSAALGHHSVAAYFDTSQVMEVQGELVEVSWRNPHIGFTLEVQDEDGEEVTWAISSTSLSHLGRFGLTEDLFSLGDIVTVVGAPSRRPIRALQASNMLFPDGREIVLNSRGNRYWTEGAEARIRLADIDARDDGPNPDRSLFRVWSTLTYDPDQDRLAEESYPLTAAARAAQAAWDPLVDNPIINCVAKGMPGVMGPPYPMELIDQGDVIVLRQEENDSVRAIHMNAETTPANPRPTDMGHSVGRWDGETLVVKTSHVNWPYFDGSGIPLSEGAAFDERFTVSADGKRLNYTLLITDPETFTEPLLLDRFWLWIPGMKVEPYDCTLR